MEVLEKIPAEGDQFNYEGLQVQVLRMQGKRIELVEIVETDEDEDEQW